MADRDYAQAGQVLVRQVGQRLRADVLLLEGRRVPLQPQVAKPCADVHRVALRDRDAIRAMIP